MKEILLRKSDELSGACRNYLEQLKSWLTEVGKQDFGNREISLALRKPIATVKRHHYQLVELGYLVANKPKGSRSYRYQLSTYAKEDKRLQTIETLLNTTLEQLNGSVTAQSSNEPSNTLKTKHKTPTAQ